MLAGQIIGRDLSEGPPSSEKMWSSIENAYLMEMQ